MPALVHMRGTVMLRAISFRGLPANAAIVGVAAEPALNSGCFRHWP